MAPSDGETTRLGHGQGPEVTVPPWADDEAPPRPDQWLDWFVSQSREAQLQIAAYHLALDSAVVGIRTHLASEGLV